MSLASSGPQTDGEGDVVVGAIEEPGGEPVGGAESAPGPTDDVASEPLAYEIVFDCKDKMLGARLAQRLDEVLGPTYGIARTEEGPSWAVAIRFPSQASADRFFDSDFYRQFCIEARRSCRSAVLVVPLGPV